MDSEDKSFNDAYKRLQATLSMSPEEQRADDKKMWILELVRSGDIGIIMNDPSFRSIYEDMKAKKEV